LARLKIAFKEDFVLHFIGVDASADAIVSIENDLAKYGVKNGGVELTACMMRDPANPSM
ncbi:MAG: hypothetical protein Q9226_008003, partial [Calogaya cf. arnoldii]